jgi:hypothetical protein
MTYTFNQPVRYYKANDPYYYEVDNIPIRQLEENVLYLKEKLEAGGGSGGGGTGTGSSSEIDIYNIKQLKPKVLNGRTLTVNAGRFSARINDAYSLMPLTNLIYQNLSPSIVQGIPQNYPPLIRSWSTAQVQQVWDSFVKTQSSGGSPCHINGLEYTYTFHIGPGGIGGNYEVSPGAGGSTAGGSENGVFPHYKNASRVVWATWPWQTAGSVSPDTVGISTTGALVNDADMWAELHLAFVKQWRSPFRTSVVDFKGGTFDIPAFDDFDYWWRQGSTGETPIPGAIQRIDLLVLYALPIDASSTAVTDYTNTFCAGGNLSPKTLVQPTLGLVRGAGIGIHSDSAMNLVGTEEGCGDPGEAGSKRILANVNDGDSTAPSRGTGITDAAGNVIYGSFPSPDDLINQAPLLALDVTGIDRLSLVGQTALPLAYVVVNKNATTLSDEDIIDIRPFMRTTELSYNERAGVAAANPPLSLGNPAVGLNQLQATINSLVARPGGGGGGSLTSGRALYSDCIMGGLLYGVEGTLLTMNENNTAANDPWGTNTTTASINIGGTTYSFANFTSSKAFTENTSPATKRAFLSWLYQTKQADLRGWISDPNNSYGGANSNHPYQNIPSVRNIPLFPEWDPPLNTQNAGGVVASNSAPPSYWMWLEGVRGARPYLYFPGGGGNSGQTKKSGSLYKGAAWPRTQTAGIDRPATTQVVTKELRVKFPNWVQDYDILVDYINCNPYGGAMGGISPHTSIGNGLYVSKGPIEVNSVGEFEATIVINSMADAVPQDLMMNTGGVLQHEFAQGLQMPQWLSYSVVLPQCPQTLYKTEQQSGGSMRNTLPLVPKIGASYYPTVKFTLIGYDQPIIGINNAWRGNFGNGTYIPTNAINSSSEAASAAVPPIYSSGSPGTQLLTPNIDLT